jgi:hypothetical protein
MESRQSKDGENNSKDTQIIPYYADSEVELVFHLDQLSAEDENLFESDLVAILWSREASVDKLLPEVRANTLRAVLFICVSPASDAASCGLYRIRIVPSPAIQQSGSEILNSDHKPIALTDKNFDPLFGPLLDGMVVRRESLGRLVRETVISAALHAIYGLQGQMRPVLRRSAFIHHLIGKYRQAQGSIANYYNEML